MNESQGSCVLDPTFVVAMDPAIVPRSTTVEVIYKHIKTLQAGIIRALTVDVEEFFRQCDPRRDNMCLYGTKEGGWKIDQPADEVPSDLPEPTVGINFARDGMNRKDWLTFVALHSDAWLLSLTAFYGSELCRDERKRLMVMLSDLTTSYDIITGKDHRANQEAMILEKVDGFEQGNQIDQVATCNYIHHTVVSQYGIPEQAVAEVSTARTDDRGSDELPSGSAEMEVVNERANFTSDPPATPLKRWEEKQTTQSPLDGKQQQQTVNTTTITLSERSVLQIALPIQMDASPSVQSNGQSEETSADTRLSKVSNPAQRPPAPLRTKRQTKPVGTYADFLYGGDFVSDEDDEHDDGPCDVCRGKTPPDDATTWVQCDGCQKWVHCECMKITPSKAKHMKNFKCLSCRGPSNELLRLVS